MKKNPLPEEPSIVLLDEFTSTSFRGLLNRRFTIAGNDSADPLGCRAEIKTDEKGREIKRKGIKGCINRSPEGRLFAGKSSFTRAPANPPVRHFFGEMGPLSAAINQLLLSSSGKDSFQSRVTR